jgi:hypothetical protein
VDRNAFAVAVKVLSSGKILVAGNAYPVKGDKDKERDTAFALLDTNGGLAHSFARGKGKQIIAVDADNNDFVNAIVQDGDSIMAAGGLVDVSGVVKFFAMKIDAESGEPNAGFGTGGWNVLNFGCHSEPKVNLGAMAIALGKPNDILLAGTSNITGQPEFGVAALDRTTGEVDPMFGQLGTYVVPFKLRGSYSQGLAVQGDGNIVVVGRVALRVEASATTPIFGVAMARLIGLGEKAGSSGEKQTWAIERPSAVYTCDEVGIVEFVRRHPTKATVRVSLLDILGRVHKDEKVVEATTDVGTLDTFAFGMGVIPKSATIELLEGFDLRAKATTHGR